MKRARDLRLVMVTKAGRVVDVFQWIAAFVTLVFLTYLTILFVRIGRQQ